MSSSKFLTGEEIVAKGATKILSTLPEVGVKDVLPNGSWLEQKQIQAALEARKHLIEIERIDKCGALSHADWCDDLKLAEVTKKSGSHWQYFGHNIGTKLFLKPEETLFLMEVNCLRLKYDGITVSLQQAYSLLLKNKIDILQYKVYASLSRLGYKVFRHESVPVTDYEKKINVISFLKKNNGRSNPVPENNKECDMNAKNDNNQDQEEKDSPNNSLGPKPCGHIQNECSAESLLNDAISTNSYNTLLISKLQKLKKRKNNTLKFLTPNSFDNIPEILHQPVVQVNVPERIFIPESINFTKSTYVLNIKNVTEKTIIAAPETRTYSLSDEVNGANVLRIQDSLRVETPNWIPQNIQQNTRRSPNNNYQQQFFRTFSSCSQRSLFSNFPFHLAFNPPFAFGVNFPNARYFNRSYYHSQHRYRSPRPQNTFHTYGGSITFDINNQRFVRKRPYVNTQYRDNYEASILASIKQAAFKLKQRINLGINNQAILHNLQRIIQDYNARYGARLTLNSRFDLVNEEEIETVVLDNDVSPNSKRVRYTQPEHTTPEYLEHLNAIRELAMRLKNLGSKGDVCSKDRRAFSKLIKTFNNSYKADIYTNESYEVCDRRQIVLDSSSDSDCVIQEDKTPKAKKLKNPFNILKRLSIETKKNIGLEIPSTSTEYVDLQEFKYNEKFKKKFNNWLPDENDFGRAEIVPKTIAELRLADSNKMSYLYSFMTEYKTKHDNWVDLKIYFWEIIKHNSDLINEEHLNNKEHSSCCNDKNLFSMCKKNIIKGHKEISSKTELAIHFDVYERNVQNFKKSQRPAPHFRIICLEASSHLPSGEDIVAVHSLLNDSVPVAFAVVNSSSISYLQIKPEDLPQNIQENDFLI